MADGPTQRELLSLPGVVAPSREAWMAAVDAARDRGEELAVVLFDPVQFHRINVRLGQFAGTEVLERAARRAANTPGVTLVCQSGGTILVATPAEGVEAVVAVAEAVVERLRRPVSTDAGEVGFGVIAGAALPHPGLGLDELVEQAFLACRSAKVSRAGIVVYERALGIENWRRNKNEDAIHLALELDQFIVYYQPKIRLADGKITGVEALARQRHPLLGVRTATDFIADAERAGLVEQIGNLVLNQAVAQAAAWQTLKDAPRVWINLSSDQLRRGHQLVDRVRRLRDRYRLQADKLGFEVTESVLLPDLDAACTTLDELRAMGFDVALDDFGTGYSSLAYLRRLPVSVVKLDRQFISGIGSSKTDEAIIQAISDLAHGLGMIVVAEGVERMEQLEALRDFSVDHVQGFLFSAAVEPDRVETMLPIPWGSQEVARELATREALDTRSVELLAERRPAMRELLARSRMLIGFADESGHFIFLNPAARKVFGIGADEELRGVTIHQVLQPTPEMTAALKEVLGDGVWRGQLRLEPSRGAPPMDVMCELHLLPNPVIPGHQLVTALAYDVSPLADGSRRAARQQELQSTVSHLAQRGLEIDLTTTDLLTEDIFEELRVLLEADLIYVARVDDSTATLIPEVIVASNSVRTKTLFAPIALGRVPNFFEHLHEVSGIETSGDRDRRPWARELQSVFGTYPGINHRFVALRADTRVLGVIGMFLRDGARHWVDLEDEFFMQIALTIGTTMARRTSDVNAAASQERAMAILSSMTEIVMVIDGDGLFRQASARIASLGYRPGELVGKNFLSLLHEDDRDLALRRFNERIGGQTVDQTVVRVRHRDGTYSWFDVEMSPTVDAQLEGYVVSIRDVSYRQAIEGRAGDAFNDLRLRFASWGLRTSSEGSVADLPPLLDELRKGLNADLMEVWTFDRRAAHPLASSPCPVGPPRSLPVWVERMLARRKTGELITVVDHSDSPEVVGGVALERSWCVPMIGGGQVFGLLLAGSTDAGRRLTTEEHDLLFGVSETVGSVLARQRAEDLSLSSSARLVGLLNIAQRVLERPTDDFVAELPRLAAQIAELLDVDVVRIEHLDPDDAQRNAIGCYGAHDCVDQDCATVLTASAQRYPDLYARWRAERPVIVTDLASETGPWAEQLRALCGPLGAVMSVPLVAGGRWLGVLVVGTAGRRQAWSRDELTVVRILAEMIAQVLERLRVGDALSASEARFKMLSETAADLVVLFDPSGRITYCSPSSLEYIGLPASDLLERDIKDFVHPEDFAEVRALAEASGISAHEFRLIRADGGIRWVAAASRPVRDPGSGEVREYRSSLRDITDLKRLEAELNQRALHDPLTGLANRVLLHEHLAGADEPGSDGKVAVLMVDVDGFKTINDTYGHAVGDVVLQTLAERLRVLCRDDDVLARTGGDEFVVFCRGMSLAEAVRLGEAILEITAQPIHVFDQVVSTGLSVGVAMRSGPWIDAEAVLTAADDAMYAAKRAGGRQVFVAASSNPWNSSLQ